MTRHLSSIDARYAARFNDCAWRDGSTVMTILPPPTTSSSSEQKSSTSLLYQHHHPHHHHHHHGETSGDISGTTTTGGGGTPAGDIEQLADRVRSYVDDADSVTNVCISEAMLTFKTA